MAHLVGRTPLYAGLPPIPMHPDAPSRILPDSAESAAGRAAAIQFKRCVRRGISQRAAGKQVALISGIMRDWILATAVVLSIFDANAQVRTVKCLPHLDGPNFS